LRCTVSRSRGDTDPGASRLRGFDDPAEEKGGDLSRMLLGCCASTAGTWNVVGGTMPEMRSARAGPRSAWETIEGKGAEVDGSAPETNGDEMCPVDEGGVRPRGGGIESPAPWAA